MTLERKLLSKLPWALAGVLAVVLAWPLDGWVDAALATNRDSLFIDLAHFCSQLGEGWVPALFGILLCIFFMQRHRPAVAAKIFFAVVTCELIGLIAVILRVFVGRARPSAPEPQGFYGLWYHGHWTISNYDFNSFPSGHSATAAGLAAAAWLMHRGWGVVVAIYALFVMWSRIALECHHFSDIVASTVLAIPLAMLSKKILWPPIEREFTSSHPFWQKFAFKKQAQPLAGAGQQPHPANLRIK